MLSELEVKRFEKRLLIDLEKETGCNTAGATLFLLWFLKDGTMVIAEPSKKVRFRSQKQKEAVDEFFQHFSKEDSIDV
jgi:hypothetical protein